MPAARCRPAGTRRPPALVAALVGALLAWAAAPAHAQWQSETISQPGAVDVLDLSLDRQGRALALWEGFAPERSPQRYTARAVRGPGGAWGPEGDVAGLTWGQARLHTYATTRTLLVGLRRISPVGQQPTRYETVAAFGRSDGDTGTLRPLGGRDALGAASAVNRAGDAIVAWAHRTRADIQVAERAAGHPFRRATTRSPRGASRHTVAMNARGDRVLAWYRRGSVEARIRRKGGSWGSVLRIGPAAAPHPESLHATVSPTGRILVAWGAQRATESTPALVEARVGIRNRQGGWVSRRLDRFTAPLYSGDPRALPFFDATGRAYVSWAGPAGGGYEVKVAQIATTTVRPPAIVSDSGDAVLEDVAAAVNGDVAVAWRRLGEAGLAPVAVTRRTGREGFEPPERLSGPGERALGDILVGFDPLSGVPTALWTVLEGDRAVVRASTRTG